MKTPLLLKKSLLGAASLLAVASTANADFGVSLRSTANSSVDTLSDRLYKVASLGTATANRLPSGTAFWFIFDTAGDGVPAFGATAGMTFTLGSILGPDDVVFEQTLSSSGRIARSVTPHCHPVAV